MIDFGYWSTKRIAALIMLLSSVALAVALWSFGSRGGVSGGVGPTYERAAFVLSVVLTVVAVKVLEGPLAEANAANLARISSAVYLIAGPVLLVGEGLALGGGRRSAAFIIVFYVFLAFFAQGVLGGALIKSGLVPALVGWLTLVWNLGIAILLPIVSPNDLYFPISHGLMPPVIAISIFVSDRGFTANRIVPSVALDDADRRELFLKYGVEFLE